MFAALTFKEWDTLCSMLERAMAKDIPSTYSNTSYERYELCDEIAEVHGLLMERPTYKTPDQVYAEQRAALERY
jgi:hypothetical protein